MRLVTAGDWRTLHRLFGTLVECGIGQIARPALAESWEQSPDGAIWTFTLRAGLKWSDGSALLPQQVVASFERGLLGTSHTEFSTFVEKVDLTSDGRVQFFLKKAPKNFLINLSFIDLAVVHPDAYSGEKFAWAAPSSGPYRLSVFDDAEMVLDRNPHYWEKLPRALQSVQVLKGSSDAEDVKTLLKEDWDACQLGPGAANSGDLDELRKKYSVHVGWPDFLFGLDWSRRKSKSGELPAQFRAYALKKIYRQFWKGLPEDPLRGVGLRPEGTLGAITRKEFDLILDSIPEDGAPSCPKNLVVLIREMFKGRDGVERLLSSIEEAGFRVTRKYVSTQECERLRESGDFDLSICYLGASEADPDSAWRIFNESILAAPVATREELALAQLESDLLKRSEIYKEFERKLVKEGLMIPIRYETTYMVTSNRVVVNPQVINDWGLQPFKLQRAE
jgi:ABC-type oligopeptide transport system substrate-binding subunit